jgi:hypothetical protein
MADSGQLTFQTMGGDTVVVPKRGKHFIQAKGYADRPGTGPVGETCGSCQHHCVLRYAKAYHKCGLTRAKWTGGRRTDILVRSPACSKWASGEATASNHDAGDTIR